MAVRTEFEKNGFDVIRYAAACSVMMLHYASYSMIVSEQAADIMDKANRKVIGEYLYHSGKVLIREGEEMLWEHTFRLYVREDEVILHDLNGEKYYMLEQ